MVSCNLSTVIDQKPLPISLSNVVPCILLSLAFVIGTPGNILVIWSIYRKLKNISTTTLLIGNLAIADFLILSSLPIWVYTFAVNKWVFGLVFCKILVYVIYSSLYVSVFLITLLSIERFLAVFRPFDRQRWTRQRVFQKITIFIWITASVLGIHSLPFSSPIQSKEPFQCILHEYNSDTQKVVFLLLEIFVMFMVPFCITIICYTYLWRKLRKMKFVGKRKSNQIIILVVVTYVICWIPLHIFNIVDIMSVLLDSCSLVGIVAIGGDISGALVFINSCLNPILYFYYSFRINRPTIIIRLNVLFENIGEMEPEQEPRENHGNNTISTPIDNSAMVASDLQMA